MAPIRHIRGKYNMITHYLSLRENARICASLALYYLTPAVCMARAVHITQHLGCYNRLSRFACALPKALGMLTSTKYLLPLCIPPPRSRSTPRLAMTRPGPEL
ncbi:hypothetical protein K503DRAFT_785085 [Rhizopogon vinicolor AM-OR11-026]|uniref:Uncharacterized protein n=1 Tax=Rhizopogon vinicolor AM-OR11-026 TaxID=1314800 RepID=A0A1B7MS60_9AGAM|nr:hypothetical protein K503DRAFT_785085 [Rhizopogon vinicolor AM-OR11-026]